MKKSCATESCGVAGTRVCTATEDAFCQQCSDIRPGHRTWYDTEVDGNINGCNTQPCPFNHYSTLGCEGVDCCQQCVSTCQAGQHSSGCGDPVNDNGGSTANTQCIDCPINTFTQVSAETDLNFTSEVGAESCALDMEEPHLWDTSSDWSYTPWSSKTTILTQSNRMHDNSYTDRKEQPPDGRTYNTEEKFLQFYGSAADVTTNDITSNLDSCSARAYQCVPCRTVPKKTSWNYDTYTTVSFYAKDTDGGYEFGRKNQPAWGTDGETGQTFCRSWWNAWGADTMGSLRSHADDYPAPALTPVIFTFTRLRTAFRPSRV